MKEKDITKGEQLERIDSELFSSFGSEDEMWIGGGGYTITCTSSVTFTQNTADHVDDMDIDFGSLD